MINIYNIFSNLQNLINKVTSAVRKKYPSIEISKKAKKPGKN